MGGGPWIVYALLIPALVVWQQVFSEAGAVGWVCRKLT